MSTPPPSPAPGVGLRTVLVIDDDDLLRSVLLAGLEANGFRALGADGATSGAELARANLPDLILCDIDMPGTNGRTLLRSLRADPELADRQFVLMTGNTAYADPRAAMDAGADDFLIKPFTLEDLTACVTARLRRAQISRHLENRVIEQLRTSLHSTLPHEFFTPLAGVFGLTELLLEELDDLNKDEIRKIVSEIMVASKRLHRTLRNYLTILELNSAAADPGDAAPVPAEVVEQSVREGATLAAKRHGREGDLQFTGTPGPARCPGARLVAVTEELVDNALAASRHGTPVRVDLRAAAGKLALTVTDSGRGMSAKQLQQLGVFQQHERKKFEQQGLGLGLVLVQRVADRYGGDLRLASEPGRGTTASVTLPSGT